MALPRAQECAWGDIERRHRPHDMTCPVMPGASGLNYWRVACVMRQVNRICRNCQAGKAIKDAWDAKRAGRVPVAKESAEMGLMKNQGKVCSVKGCNEPAYCKGMCKRHYWNEKDRLKRERQAQDRKPAASVGEMLAPENDPALKGAGASAPGTDSQGPTSAVPEGLEALEPEAGVPAGDRDRESLPGRTVVTCRCGCGTVGRMHGRGLVKQCYDRIKRAGRLVDFPPLIDSPRAAEIAGGGGKIAAHSGYDAAGFARALDRVLAELRSTLVAKNKAYGDSALNPVRVFSKADPVEQLRVRIDDKLSRLMRGQDAGEDTEGDLLGYLVLLRVATAQARSR